MEIIVGMIFFGALLTVIGWLFVMALSMLGIFMAGLSAGLLTMLHVIGALLDWRLNAEGRADDAAAHVGGNECSLEGFKALSQFDPRK